MKTTEMVLFSKDDAAQLLADLGFTVNTKSKNPTIRNKDGSVEKCESCRQELHLHDVGNIAPGSRLLFCSKPMCLATWIALNKVG